MFKSVLNWSSGKKTYISIGLGIGVAVLQAFHIPIPWYVDLGLGFAGLGAFRLGVAKQTKLAQDSVVAIQNLASVYQDIMSQVKVPDQSTTVRMVPGATVQIMPNTSVTLGEPSTVKDEAAETAALNAAQSPLATKT